MKTAKRMQIPPSATVKMYDLANQKKKQGIHVHNFAAGDPVVPIHPRILEGLENGLRSRMAPYSPLMGTPELRAAAAQWNNECYQSHYSLENTLVTPGGKFSLFLLLQTLLDSQDEALIFSPYWVSYPPMVRLCEAKPIIVPTRSANQWKLPLDDLEKYLTEKTKLIILNNGCNPTGALYTREEIQHLLQLAKFHGLFVISDEVYSEINYTHTRFISCSQFEEHKARVAIVQSASKNFGMTGWRIGFVFAEAELIQLLATLQSQSTSGPSIVSQWAALGALNHWQEVSQTMKKTMHERRDLFASTFKELFQTSLNQPDSAIYQFIHLKDLGIAHKDSLSFCEKLLERSNVALVPGIAFGQEGYVRFAFSEKEEEMISGLQQLRLFCERITQ